MHNLNLTVRKHQAAKIKGHSTNTCPAHFKNDSLKDQPNYKSNSRSPLRPLRAATLEIQPS